jgi:hypothetical protein
MYADRWYLLSVVRLSDGIYMAHQKVKDPDEARKAFNLLKEEFIDTPDDTEIYTLNSTCIDYNHTQEQYRG